MTILIVLIILLGTSFSTLSPLEAGLKVNAISPSLEGTKVYTAGRYCLGFMYKFIRYPTTLKTIEWSTGASADGPPMIAQTSGGQTVTLEISFQYRLIVSELLNLYSNYAMTYHTAFVTVAQTEIRSLITKYDSTDYFFSQRESVALAIHAALNTRMRDYYAVVEHFQLRNIDIRSSTEQQILSKLTKAQEVKTAVALQNGVSIRAVTEVIKSNYSNQALISVAKAKTEAAYITNGAYAESIGVGINASANAYRLLKETLNFTNTDLIRYLYLEAMQSLDGSSKLTVGTPTALFTF